MKPSDTAFSGSIPALYDRFLGPLIFADYAERLAHGVAARPVRRVLETAAGTGIVTRALVARLGGASVVATDLNPAMLAFAQTATPADNVEWRPADACALPLEDASFDAVVCQFGAMFFPDKVKAYREALRVLAPGGRFLFNVWDRIDENEFAAVVTQALALHFPNDPPRFLARTPHGYHDVAAIRAQLQEAGFAHVEVETVPLACRAASYRDPATGFCQGTPLRGEIEARDPAGLEAATDAAAAALAERFGSGPIEGRMQAHVFVASR
jgi:ubiquinone/menaquinone biosynthesis C-methylase UbiE